MAVFGGVVEGKVQLALEGSQVCDFVAISGSVPSYIPLAFAWDHELQVSTHLVRDESLGQEVITDQIVLVKTPENLAHLFLLGPVVEVEEAHVAARLGEEQLILPVVFNHCLVVERESVEVVRVRVKWSTVAIKHLEMFGLLEDESHPVFSRLGGRVCVGDEILGKVLMGPRVNGTAFDDMKRFVGRNGAHVVSSDRHMFPNHVRDLIRVQLFHVHGRSQKIKVICSRRSGVVFILYRHSGASNFPTARIGCCPS